MLLLSTIFERIYRWKGHVINRRRPSWKLSVKQYMLLENEGLVLSDVPSMVSTLVELLIFDQRGTPISPLSGDH